MYIKPVVLSSLILLAGCNSESEDFESCVGVSPVVSSGDTFWDGANIDLYTHVRQGYQSAIACHNCYDYEESQARSTTNIIENAIDDGSQLIELDLVYSDEQQGWFINHGTNGNYIDLVNVLTLETLVEENYSLFLEIKGSNYSQAQLAELFSLLKSVSTSFGDIAYFNQQRFTTIRSQSKFELFKQLREALSAPEFSDIQPFVKFSKILTPSSFPGMFKKVEFSKQCGMHMVEFSSNSQIDDVKDLASHANSIGLGTSIHTIDDTNFQVIVGGLKGNIDVFNVEPIRNTQSLYRSETLSGQIKRILTGD